VPSSSPYGKGQGSSASAIDRRRRREPSDRVEKLSPGEVAEIEIDLSPVGLAFRPGEQLRLIVSAQNLIGPMMPGIREYLPQKSGQHVVHTGDRTRRIFNYPW
jgi:uncharacterized protein